MKREYFGLSDVLMFGPKLPKEDSKARCPYDRPGKMYWRKGPEAEVYPSSGPCLQVQTYTVFSPIFHFIYLF